MALSPTGRHLALSGSDRTVRLADLQAGKVVDQWPSGAFPCQVLTFSGDGRTLAWLEPGKALHLRDLDSGRDRRTIETGAAFLAEAALSHDGQLLGTMHHDQAGIVVWDTRTGKRVRRYLSEAEPRAVRGGMVVMMGEGGGRGGQVVFGREGRTVIGLLDQRLQVWEIDSIERKLAMEDATGFKQLAVSADVRYLVGVTQAEGIRVHRLDTGKLIHNLDNQKLPVTAVALAPDGTTLAIGLGTGRIRLWDLAAGKEKAGVPAVTLQPQVAGFAQGGKEVVTVAPDHLTRWSVRTGKALGRIPLGLETLAQAGLSADGRTAAVAGSDASLRILDTGSGAQLCQIPRNPEEQGAFALSPDGRLLASLGVSEKGVAFVVHDARTGKPRLSRQVEGLALNSDALFFDAGSRVLYTGHSEGDLLQALEMSTGKPRRPLRLPRGTVGGMGMVPPHVRMALMMRQHVRFMGGGSWARGLVFGPDGRSYVLPRGDRLSLHEVHTGRLLRSFDGAEGDVDAVALSPDATVLAGGDEQGLRLWDFRTGRLQVLLSGHRGKVSHLAFSPDGRRLLSVAGDGTVLVWNVAEALRLPAPAPRPSSASRRSIQTLWTALASEDPSVAETAADELRERPGETVRLLQTRLRPIPPVEPARLARLIQDLDSSEASVRDQASAQLAGLDELARQALAGAANSPSAEVRRRVKQLIERLERGQLSGEEARPLRAVELLEHLGTPEARGLLKRLAGGASPAPLTRAAAGALDRLAGRSDPGRAPAEKAS